MSGDDASFRLAPRLRWRERGSKGRKGEREENIEVPIQLPSPLATRDGKSGKDLNQIITEGDGEVKLGGI